MTHIRWTKILVEHHQTLSKWLSAACVSMFRFDKLAAYTKYKNGRGKILSPRRGLHQQKEHVKGFTMLNLNLYSYHSGIISHRGTYSTFKDMKSCRLVDRPV